MLVYVPTQHAIALGNIETRVASVHESVDGAQAYAHGDGGQFRWEGKIAHDGLYAVDQARMRGFRITEHLVLT